MTQSSDGERAPSGGVRSSGFTLIESLVGLTVLFVVLVGLAAGLAVTRRAAEGLRLQRAADRALESSLEALRAAPDVPRSGPLPAPAAWDLRAPLALGVTVEPLPPQGLHRVTLSAAYLHRGATIERRLVSQVWRPR
ncbi:MAG TPA: type II secretion system protein [Thermoanaerobaculia bacterium]|nr:type II secretion system protein [Thermoanaerobaculia bacterium]